MFQIRYLMIEGNSVHVNILYGLQSCDAPATRDHLPDSKFHRCGCVAMSENYLLVEAGFP